MSVLNYNDLKDRIAQHGLFFEVWVTHAEWKYIISDIEAYKRSEVLNFEEENNPDIVAKIDNILIKSCDNENLKYNLVSSV